MTKHYDRFDLEEEIMNIWQTEDDLDAVVHRMMEDPDPIPNKEIANLLIAVSKLHNLRCQKLFDIFEKMVIDKCFVSKETSLDYRGVPLEDEDAMQGKFWPSEEIEEY
jgi:hypothetical protein